TCVLSRHGFRRGAGRVLRILRRLRRSLPLRVVRPHLRGGDAVRKAGGGLPLGGSSGGDPGRRGRGPRGARQRSGARRGADAAHERPGATRADRTLWKAEGRRGAEPRRDGATNGARVRGRDSTGRTGPPPAPGRTAFA